MNFLNRVKNILLTPKSEFSTVRAEATTIAEVYFQYLALLALLPAIGNLLSFHRYTGLGGMGYGLRLALMSYVVSLASVYVSALIIDGLANSFSSTKNRTNAFKLVAYAITPSMVAGLLALVPGLRTLISLVGLLYSIYLFYVGLPLLMDTPKERVTPYMIAAFIVSIIVYFVLYAVLSPILGISMRSW